MRIAELERRTGVSRHTLRFYEKEGLLVDVARRDNNYRDYPESAVEHVRLLRQLKELGFSLAEVREIAQSVRSDQLNCADGAALMARKRREISERIESLRALDVLLQAEQDRLERSWALHGAT